MVKSADIGRFFRALAGAGGELTRTRLAVGIFSRNWSAALLDELISQATLLGLITEFRGRVRSQSRDRAQKIGRSPLRYVLTPAGWEIAQLWQLPIKTAQRAPERVQELFQGLIQEGNPWARDLDRDARAWRVHQVREKEKQAARLAEEKEKAREFAKANKPPRKRSEKDLTARRLFVQSKREERESTSQTARPMIPARAQFPVHPSAPPPMRPQPSVQTYLDGEALAEIRKITSAGYRCNERGEVLYDNRWISRREWKEKMPGIID